ncbi:MAG TPA: terminase family protein [Alphaproteobacteria bacterium]|nr:terminase family protein [Alphaproteobacteria bacterium]
MDQIDLLKKLLPLLQREKATREKEVSRYDWSKNARQKQIPPQGDWRIWLILAGRGFGKTRTGAETLRQWVREGLCSRIALVAETDTEIRQVMVEGDSGLLSVHPPAEKPLYEPANRQLTWPNGAIATCYSAEAYERLRGSQFDGAWVDELAKFREKDKVWDQLMFGLRLGKNPRVVVTTTPRPSQFLKNLMNDPQVIVTRGSTFENTKNLAQPFLDYMSDRYKNSWLGRQELYADIIEEKQGALWTPSLLEQARNSFKKHDLMRLVIAIDPAVSNGAHSDETGIIAAGITSEGIGVVLEDLSIKAPAHIWMQRAIKAYHRLKADRIVAEVNMGGDLVEGLLRSYDTLISYKAVHATRNKTLRAEPIASLYELGKVWHADYFPQLEEQLCSYVPGESSKSPDRLDALVWALTDLMIDTAPKYKIWAG